MTFSFDSLPEALFPAFKGGEKAAAIRTWQDDLNRIMQVVLEPGASVGMHTHTDNSEIIYVIRGAGKAVEESGERPLKAGMCHYCPKGSSHSVVNDGTEDLVLFAVVPAQ